MRFELTTSTLARWRSTTELHPHRASCVRTGIMHAIAHPRNKKIWKIRGLSAGWGHDLAGMDKLLEILAHKRQEIAPVVARLPRLRAAAAARSDIRPFAGALRADAANGLGLIAEVKKSSPSAGIINAEVDPVAQAVIYAQAGASAISVLTDEKYFSGKLDYLIRIRKEVAVPVLRKDFVVHEAQIYEAAVAGADAILLIVAALPQDDLIRFLELARTLGLDALVEVHDEAEMERALVTDATLIGVNNRNLRTFETDLATTGRLARMTGPQHFLISESGIKSAEDARTVRDAGAKALLVGETLMRAEDVAAMVQALMRA